MTALTLIGDKEGLKTKIQALVNDFNLNEIIVHTNIYNFEAKLKSYKITQEVFQDINSKT